MAQESWRGKYPADMTDEELREAKTFVADALAPAQETLNTMSAAVQHLDLEINRRFQMGNYASVNPASLPTYPVEVLTGEKA